MKRLTIIAILMAVCSLGMYARGKKPIVFQDLPQAVQDSVLQNFTEAQIEFITSKKVQFRTYEYKFIMLDNTQMEYDNKARLHEIESPNGVPAAFIPQEIQDYVQATFPNTLITKYERELLSQKVKLSNKMDLVFSKSGKFIRIDD